MTTRTDDTNGRGASDLDALHDELLSELQAREKAEGEREHYKTLWEQSAREAHSVEAQLTKERDDELEAYGSRGFDRDECEAENQRLRAEVERLSAACSRYADRLAWLP